MALSSANWRGPRHEDHRTTLRRRARGCGHFAEKPPKQVSRELRDFLALLRESPQLGVLLGSPAVSRANKHAVVEALVERMGASRTLRNFLFVVIDQRRMALLPEIQQAFDAQLDDRQGVARADVTSARELNERERKQLRAVTRAAERPARGSEVSARPRADCGRGGAHRLNDL